MVPLANFDRPGDNRGLVEKCFVRRCISHPLPLSQAYGPYPPSDHDVPVSIRLLCRRRKASGEHVSSDNRS